MNLPVRMKEELTWRTAADYLMLILGALIQAFAMRLFLVPSQLLSGGVSGAAQIVQSFTGWPIGVMVFIGNLPLFFLGWRYLGGARFAIRTGVAITAFSMFTDMLVFVMPAEGLTHDMVLSSIFGGLMFGAGLGLVYRAKGTSGGSDILGQILYHRKGIPITQAYFVTDTIVLLAGGIFWSWELALYGLIVMYVSGLAAEMILEGPSVLRTVTIISYEPQQVAKEIMTVLERGVTILAGKGAYTGKDRPVLYCVVTRSEVNKIKALVHGIDEDAFIVVGGGARSPGRRFQAVHTAWGVKAESPLDGTRRGDFLYDSKNHISPYANNAPVTIPNWPSKYVIMTSRLPFLRGRMNLFQARMLSEMKKSRAPAMAQAAALGGQPGRRGVSRAESNMQEMPTM